jgi:sugar lactone lactonase YvrE
MSQRARGFMAFLLYVVPVAVCAWAYVSLAAQSASLPNPYRPVEGWAKLPPGRTWGAPAAVDIDRDGRSLWVFERCGEDSCAGSNLPPILKFDPSGTLVKSFGAGMIIFPHGLHVDADGNVWVAETPLSPTQGQQVFKFSPEGKLLLTVGKAGVMGDGPDTFNMPSDVATAPNGDIFVADGHVPLTTNMRIVKFSKDGKFITAWGKKGTGRGELDDPHAIAFDSRGRLFVADRGNRRLQIFDQNGGYIDEWQQFGSPSGLFITRDDTLYVADLNSGIRIGSARDGVVTAEIKAPAPATGRVRTAESVAVDAAGQLYAGENAAKKLMKFVK